MHPAEVLLGSHSGNPSDVIDYTQIIQRTRSKESAELTHHHGYIDAFLFKIGWAIEDARQICHDSLGRGIVAPEPEIL